MKQGSNMTRGHNGMRKGISLMEMMVAVIMLGILSSVGYNYYKNYFDTSLAAKQIKVSVLIEQASQLKNALELYRIKFGADANTTLVNDPTDINNGLGLLASQRIITEIPAPILDMSEKGWFVSTAEDDISSTLITSLGGTTGLDQYITYDLNGTTTASADRVQYCNALNNIASNGAQTFTVTAAALADDMNASAVTNANTFFCYDKDSNATTSAASGLRFVFITKVY